MKKIIIPIVVILILLLVGGGIYYLYQYTEIFGKKIIPTKINELSILYVPEYDLDKAKTNNDIEGVEIKIQEIVVSGKELNELKKELRKISKSEKDFSDFKDIVEISINNKTVIKINDKIGYVDKTKVNIPSQLKNDIDVLIEKNNKKILKTNKFESIVLKMEGSSITVKNKDNLKYLRDSLKYYPITLPADYKTFSDGYIIEVILDNQTHIYLYEKTNVGYIQQGEEKTFAIFTGDFKEIIKQIHDVSVE